MGVEHPELGEEVGAAVVLQEGEELSADEIREYVNGRSPPTSTRASCGSWTSSRRGRGKVLEREIQALSEAAAS